MALPLGERRLGKNNSKNNNIDVALQANFSFNFDLLPYLLARINRRKEFNLKKLASR